MATPVNEALLRWRRMLFDRGWVAAFVVYGGMFAWLILSGSFSESTRSLLANVWYLPIGGISAVLAWQVARAPDLPSKQRIAWKLIAFSLVATFISDSLWIYVENFRGQDPSGNISANLGYLLFYPAVLASLLLLPGSLRSRRDGLKFALDVGTVVVAGTMAIWHFVIAPSVAAHDPSPVAFVLALAYPVGDLLLLIGLATILLRYPAGARRRPIMWLAASTTSMLIGDVVWAHLSLTGSFDAGHIQDLPYLLQYVLFGIGIAEERRRLRHQQTDELEQGARGMTALPYMAVLGGYGLLIDVDWKHLRGELFPLAGAVILTALVIRQMVALRENVHLKGQAYYDPLTGLANRTLFQRRVEEALAPHDDGRPAAAVLFIDLDRFKVVNDSYGHDVGDAVLRASAQRIVSNLRASDTAARLGGDEFAVLLEDAAGKFDPSAIAERIAAVFHEPLTLHGHHLVVTASVGVALATPGQSAKNLPREADLAMYLAKRRGGGQAAIFEPTMGAALPARMEVLRQKS